MNLPGKIINIPVEQEIQHSYIDYSMSVIVSRALPDVRDGLKPVHRRILYAMYDQGMLPDRPYKKSAAVVGEVLKSYHPHGEAAVYDAVVRLAQDFSTRYPLVDGHGNFGSVDGDPAAAMRYTEVRLTALAMQLLQDIDKDTVDFQANFDESTQEPVVLPSRFPNLLVNGSSGIAVGMATNIPPHNLSEVVAAAIYLIDHPDATVAELMDLVPGPDFPTGGVIMGRDGIRSMYETGRGALQVRAQARIEIESHKSRIVITELPYQVNKAKLIEHIAELVREKKLEGISDLRDETDRSAGLRVVIELRRDANPRIVLNRLFKHTDMQVTFGAIMLALVDGEPRVLNLRDLIFYYLQHQKSVVTRRTKFELAQAEERAHVLAGLQVALDHLDEVIALIRAAQDTEAARRGLMSRFGLTEKQATAILDMRLQRLVALERAKIAEEYAALLKDIEYHRAVLADEAMVWAIIKRELRAVADRFGDQRRTVITDEMTEFVAEDLIPVQDVVVTLTHEGYIKRLPVATYRAQNRGGRGVTGMATREEDYIVDLYFATTHDFMFMFTNQGRVIRRKVHEIPEAGRTGRGTHLANIIALRDGERVTAVLVVPVNSSGYLFMATQRGTVKRTPVSEFDTPLRNGIVGITLDEGEELVSARLTSGQDDIILVTHQGQAIRFPEADVRPVGRSAHGVRGIALAEGDEVVAMDVLAPGAQVLIVTEGGLGKRVPAGDFRRQGRGGQGIRAIKLTEQSGLVAAARVVSPQHEILVATINGLVMRTPVSGIAEYSRYASGVTVVRLEPGDRVAGVARLPNRGEDDAGKMGK